MADGITNAEKIRRLPWNIALSATNNIFGQLTFFGSAFILFVSAQGFSNSQIGFLLSLMPFFGIVALFIAPQVARFGYKRTFVTFFGIRKIVTAFLLLVPFTLAHFGEPAARILITGIVMLFALCRAISETGLYPWAQEYIPNSIRGKHGAINDMVSRITGLLAVAFSGAVLGLVSGLNGFIILFAVALVFGVLAVWSAAHLPGGAPTNTEGTSYRQLFRVLRDGNFRLYMLALCAVTFGSAPLSFLPLFMQNQVGLSDSAVVWLQMGTIIGGFSATYLLGWASDRYGSKPVLLAGLAVKTLLPLGWLLMPRHSDWSLVAALAIAAIWGIAEIAWALGSGRLLYVQIVPTERKSEYMAVFYALAGLMGGTSQIVSGRLLDAFSGLSGRFLIFPLDAFTPLLLGSLVLTAGGVYLFRRTRAGDDISLGEFAGLFVHGNPVQAFDSLIRYHRASDERSAVVVTERMGKANSPLTVAELLEALKDPRFNVRFEAIISIARMGNEPRLVQALCDILDGTELSLSVISAWALGRMGDPAALPTLRHGVESPYRSIQAHCARSLGTLGDQASAPLLLARLRSETDKGLQIAFASALGNLQSKAALETVLHTLEATENEGARMELALAVARIGGDEARFIRLMRGMHHDSGTTAAQVLSAWKRRREKMLTLELKRQTDDCSAHFAADRAAEGKATLFELARVLAAEHELVPARILQECARQLEQHPERHEYLVLALHMLQIDEK